MNPNCRAPAFRYAVTCDPGQAGAENIGDCQLEVHAYNFAASRI